MLAIRLYTAGKSGESAYRRGIPARPRKCIGKKVKFTPKNITKNWALRRIGFIDRPVNKGNQVTIPAKRAKNCSHSQDIMEMCHHIICVMKDDIKRRIC